MEMPYMIAAAELLLWVKAANIFIREEPPVVLLWTHSLVSLQTSRVKALIPNMTVLGDEGFRETTKVKWGHKSRALIQYDWCPYEKRQTPGMPVHRENLAMWRHCKKVTFCKLRREPPGEIHPASTLILDFQPPELISVVEASQSVVFCYSSPSWLIQVHIPRMINSPY